MVGAGFKFIAAFLSLSLIGGCAASDRTAERQRASLLMASRLRAHLAKLPTRVPSNTDSGIKSSLLDSILDALPGGRRAERGVAGDQRIERALAEEEDKPKEQREDYHGSIRAYLNLFHNLDQKQQEWNQSFNLTPNRTDLTRGWLRGLYGSDEGDYCGPQKSARDNLVVISIGDHFDASKYMTDPKRSNWDIVGLYYGGDAAFKCPLCKEVYHASGLPKWRLAWALTLLDEWPAYRRNYSAIMFADDDLHLDVCTFNTVFNVMKSYKILMAQPSLCDRHWSYTLWPVLYQQPEYILRYTTMNEIMAPAFEMNFFQSFIRPTLYNAYFGWGLDFVWPFLLRFPRDKIAVVDQVCMSHPRSTEKKANSLYKAKAPFTNWEEETNRFNEYGYTAEAVKALGFPYQAAESLGEVRKPSPDDSLLWASHSALRSRLGVLYPLLFLAQSGVCLLAIAVLLCRRAWCRLKWSSRPVTLSLRRPLLPGKALPVKLAPSSPPRGQKILAWCQHIRAHRVVRDEKQLA